MDKIEQRILAILDASADRIFAFGAALARKLIAENKPLYTREEYLALRARLSKLETMEMSPVPDHFE